MATIHGNAIAGPVSRANPGNGTPGLYHYWLRLRNRPGRSRVEVTPPVSRYEQVARQLREQVFAGGYPPGSRIPSGWTSGRYPVSQPVVQRACAVLEGEGLVSMEPGRGTTVLSRSRWRVDVEAGLPGGGDPDAARAAVAGALGAAGQPAIRFEVTAPGDGRLLIVMTVESHDLPGAVAAALPVATLALGSLPVTFQSARAA